MIVSYTGGTGGNWLQRVINIEPIELPSRHFHGNINSSSPVKMVHEINPQKFDYLLTGKYYFNFYANMLYKRFYNDDRPNTYEHFVKTCINTGRFVCEYSTIQNLAFFDFDDLISSPNQYLDCVHQVQTECQIPKIDQNKFNTYRQAFVDSCVNVSNMYKNFDSMAWTCFVLGQLSLQKITPREFIPTKPQAQDRCRQFAFDNFHHCQLLEVHEFDTPNQLPTEFYSI